MNIYILIVSYTKLEIQTALIDNIPKSFTEYKIAPDNI